MTKPKILIVVTSHGSLGSTGKKTGFWLEELAVPYDVFQQAGADIDIASPAGGAPPVDPSSVNSSHPEVQRFSTDTTAQEKLNHSLKISEIHSIYDAVFVAGGHGVMWDLAEDSAVAQLLSKHYAQGAVIAAVCHGPAALVRVTTPDGTPIVANHRFTAFSNEEESAVGLTDIVPFLLEAKLSSQGGRYERGPNWGAFSVRDGRLVTGQNPASSKLTAEQTLIALAEANGA